MFVRKQVESKRVPMINIGTLFICYVLYPGFFKQTVSVVRIEILVVIQKELCQYRVVVVHFQLAGIQTMDCPSVFFRQFKLKDLEILFHTLFVHTLRYGNDTFVR